MTIPETGLVKNGVHVFPVRVYFEDTDSGGIVYYANYLRFAERARTEMLRCIGYSHSDMMTNDDLVFAVRRGEADYLRPAHLDDALEVVTGNVDIEAASLWLEQRIMRGEENLVQLKIRLACVGEGGKPKRLPNQLRDALLPLLDINNTEQ